MEKHKLKITTQADDAKTTFEMDASMRFTDRGRVLTYFQGEGKTVFYLDEGRMIRTGDYGLELEFDLQRETLAKLMLGEHTGSMPMETFEYSVVQTKDVLLITIEYILRQKGGDQKMKVCLEAKKAVETVF